MYINKKLRAELAAEIAKKLPKWEEKTALKANGWQIRKMKTKWGCCNQVGKLTLNAELLHAPLRCLDYIIVHELLHLKIRHHNKDFFAMLDAIMPYWRDIRQELNNTPLGPTVKKQTIN